MTSKLALYNRATRNIGERPLASLTEDAEARYLLDAEYDEALKFCLNEGYWNFALRAAKIDHDTGASTNFGYQFVFPKPADWLKTETVSLSEYFDLPLMDYKDQVQYWLADFDPIYVRYISTTYGTDPANFTPDYAEYVGAYLGLMIYGRITQKSEAEKSEYEKRVLKLKKNAMANDAMNQGPKMTPRGTWVTSRSRRGASNWRPY